MMAATTAPPGAAVSKLGGRIAEMKSQGRMKPRLEVRASMESPLGIDHHDWRKEDLKRLQQELEAIESQLGSWDDESAGKQARRSLEAERAMKKARIQEHRVSMKYGRRY
jgi:hypothetical protein